MPSALYVPSSQGLHVLYPAPRLIVPGAQRMQADDPSPADPLEQHMHFWLEVYVPDPHGVLHVLPDPYVLQQQ